MHEEHTKVEYPHNNKKGDDAAVATRNRYQIGDPVILNHNGSYDAAYPEIAGVIVGVPDGRYEDCYTIQTDVDLSGEEYKWLGGHHQHRVRSLPRYVSYDESARSSVSLDGTGWEALL